MDKAYKARTLLSYYYKNFQKDILLAFRPTINHSWGDRVKFLSKDFNPYKEYNHRMILDNEIIFEYDFPDLKLNKKYVDVICKRLNADGISWSKWFSGSKSYHLHLFVNPRKVNDLSLWKRTVTLYYTKGLPRPDMQMCSPHMIRMEYGVNEKTGNRKSFISKSKGFPSQSELPDSVWELYASRKRNSMSNKATYNTKDLTNSKEVRLLMDATTLKDAGDGRERALFFLIHILKVKYDKRQDLEDFLVDFYKYSGGKTMSSSEVKRKVRYHWNRSYNISVNAVSNLLDDLGIKH